MDQAPVGDRPAYVDLQVNGYAGVDFNSDDLSPDQLHFACECLRRDGVAGILATIITADMPEMTSRLRRIADLRNRDPLAADVVWGIHIEGPFINETPGFVGAHPAQHVRIADLDLMKALLDASGGLAKLVTLAPERDPGLNVTRWLADRRVRVSAGHCDPSMDQLRAAIDAGLSMFTHLGNGCPLMLHRHDNIVERVLSLHEHLTICFIGDGVHVPVPALGNYLRLAGLDRAIIVTDAIAAARLGPGRYTLGRQCVAIGEDLIARLPENDLLMGSTATMPRIDALLREQLRLPDADVQHLLSATPRSILGR